MKDKTKLSSVLIFTSFYIMFFLPTNYCLSEVSTKTGMTKEDYQNARRVQNHYHQLYRSGVQAENRNEYKRAIEYFEKGLMIVKSYSPETIFRSKLKELQEKVGDYKQALIHTEWFLEKADSSSPLYAEFLETKIRLLKKIEESKNQRPVHKDKGLGNSQGEELLTKQLAAMNAMSDQGIEGIYKKALTHESNGNYKEALEIYVSLLPKKDKVRDALGLGIWVMLYPAVQRTAELSGDVEKEKLALSWIKLYLFQPSDFSYFSRYLAPPTIDHIKSRLKHYKFN